MKKRVLKRSLIVSCCIFLVFTALTACGKKAEDELAEETSAEVTDQVEVEKEPAEVVQEEKKEEKEKETQKPKYHKSESEKTKTPELEGYKLLWSDEFDGNKLDETKWNYETHEPGWANEELQEYTDLVNNVYIENGNLVIQAFKTKDKKGKDYYTSGKITGQKKTDFMYGKVVVRAKVPKGKGLWPSITMMPTDEKSYGKWPKSGEIDIMEILGDSVETAYGTVHYGEPHKEQQGIYTLDKGTFADGFHEYSVEWEPGEIRFYIDDKLYQTVNDWYTCAEGEEEKPYPAPFDKKFYVQMSLAVGGTWPGDPDESTNFKNAKYYIDYVRVYQKPKYDTDVEKPESKDKDKTDKDKTDDKETTEKPVNMIRNGNFADSESLEDEANWTFRVYEGGAGSAFIQDDMLVVTSQEMGEKDYSLQVVQENLPLKKGKTYRFSFDACAAEERNISVCVSGLYPDYYHYMPDKVIALSTGWKTYTCEFEMAGEDDGNTRVEFNMGALGSLADVYITNVQFMAVK